MATKRRKPMKSVPKRHKDMTPSVEETAIPVKVYPRNLDEHGFMPGTDSSIIAKHLMRGYQNRGEMVEAIKEEISKTNKGLLTSSGKKKNIPSLVSSVISRLESKGYTLQTTIVMVKPKDEEPVVVEPKKSTKRTKVVK